MKRELRESAELRESIVRQLEGGRGHVAIAEALAQVPADVRGIKPDSAPHTPWELLEHMRLAQHDIVEWSFDPSFESPEFPAGYWPPTPVPPDGKAWDRSAAEFLRELRKLVRIARDPERDLLGGVPRGEDVVLLNQLLLVANHNSYHVGQLMFAVRSLSAAARTRAARKPRPR